MILPFHHITSQWVPLVVILLIMACQPVGRADQAGDPDELELLMGPDALAALEQKRQLAMQTGVLESGDADWVDAVIRFQGMDYPAELRLKGDWLDHLSGDKWSYRIKLKNDAAIFGMETFSLQSPHTRDFLSEYVFHRWMEEEDLLTTRYRFLPVSVNGSLASVYAMEEHFGKQLPESQARRSGPILKFSEESMWALRSASLKNGYSFDMAEEDLPVWETATVEAFKMKQQLKSESSRELLEDGMTLMEQYRSGLADMGEVLDLDKMARYYAIMDLCQAYHGLIWHNQRFYMNPVTSLLEPVGFDGYTEDGVFKYFSEPYIGSGTGWQSRDGSAYNDGFRFLLENREFLELYSAYLISFSRESYVEDLLNSMQEEIGQYLSLLQTEYPAYTFDTSWYLNRAFQLRSILTVSGDNALLVYTDTTARGRHELVLRNQYTMPVEVIGSSPRIDDIAFWLPKPVTMPGFNLYREASVADLTVSEESKYVFYKVPGSDSVYAASIRQWDGWKSQTARQQLSGTMNDHSDLLFITPDSMVVFRQGTHTVDKWVVIPDDYKVIIPAGTRIDLVKGAGFLSYAPVQINGEQNKPVLITSSDHTAGGFSVLQAGSSSVKYAVFSNMNTLKREGWTLTGMVNFFETDVDINHCQFLNSQCEDALNIIRSTFSMNAVRISNSYADAFDADFCRGSITNSEVSNSANDAIDISGSSVEVSGTVLKNIGDKAFSAGEDSKLFLQDCTVEGASVGVVAKDLSEVTVSELVIRDCGKGFSAYQKKPEFGPATIVVRSYTGSGLKELSHALDGSVIQMPD